MPDALSIRAYTTRPTSHAHDFHQLVLPLRGVIHIDVGSFSGKVAPGECVIVRANQQHLFNANTEARFVVADMHNLPDNLLRSPRAVFALSAPLISYLNFVEYQLQYQHNPGLEKAVFDTFYLLLAEQVLLPKVDARISAAIMHIEQNMATPLHIRTLADIACLSEAQFKKLFKQQTGYTAMQYAANVRMEKAQALLTHTDYPLQIVGEMVGYGDLSAFSRKFSQHVGLPPTKFKK